MKNTSKLIGIVAALIVVILAIFLVTKFNSHESARVSTSSSPVKTVKKSSSSSSKAVKKDKKSVQSSSSAVTNEENDNQASAVAPKVSSQEQAQAGTTDGGQSSLDFGAPDNGDISSLVGTWTNANGESVTINADGTIIKNSTGYTAQLKPQRVSDNIFYAGVFSDTSSAALRAISGGSNGSDYLVIGQDQTAEGVPYYRN